MECQICWESNDIKSLHSFCKCDGTVKYVHKECIIKWMKISGKTRCETCLTEFETYTEIQINKIEFVFYLLLYNLLSLIFILILYNCMNFILYGILSLIYGDNGMFYYIGYSILVSRIPIIFIMYFDENNKYGIIYELYFLYITYSYSLFKSLYEVRRVLLYSSDKVDIKLDK